MVRTVGKLKTHRFIFGLTLVLLSAVSARANTQQDAYEKTLDYIKCKCAEIIYSTKLGCENDANTAKIEAYKAQHPRTRSLMNELDRLKTLQVADWKKDRIIELLGSEIFAQLNRAKYPNIYSFATNKNRNTDGTVTNLQKAIEAYAQEHLLSAAALAAIPTPDTTMLEEEAEIPPTLIPVDSGLTDVDGGSYGYDDGKANNANGFFSFRFNLAHLLLFALAAGIAMYFIRRERRRYQSQIDTLKAEIAAKAERDAVDGVSARFDAFQTKLENARKRRLASKNPEYQHTLQNVIGAGNKKQSLDEVLYLTAPDASGTFDPADVSIAFKPVVSLYKFSIDPKDAGVAYFTFHADNVGLHHALSMPEKYVFPACAPFNEVFQGATNIKTLRPGIARKVNGIWRVEEEDRALVRFE